MSLSPEAVYLVEFFDRSYLPIHLAGHDRRQASDFRSSVGWISKALRREATLADLNREALATTLQTAMQVGLAHATLKKIRKHIRHVHEHAHSLGLAAPFASVPLPTAASKPLPVDDARGPLTTWYLKYFRDEVQQSGKRTWLQNHDRAVVRFDEFVAASAITETTVATLAAYEVWLAARGVAAVTAHKYRRAVLRVLRAKSPAEFLVTRGTGAAADHGPRPNHGQYKRRVNIDLPTPEPGTLRHYFEAVYVPQRLAGSKSYYVHSVRKTIAEFYAFVGRDVRLAELTDDLVAPFIASFIRRGQTARSANAAKAHIEVVWRMAWRRRLVAELPRLEKYRVTNEEVDAWSESELRALLAAVDRVPRTQGIKGVSFADYWHAALLVIYYSALRRATVFRLRTADVDLDDCRIYARASDVKTGKGQAFKIGDDCVAALRRIWSADRELLFPPLANSTLFRHLRCIIKAAELKHRQHRLRAFHKLRRSVGTLICRQGGRAMAKHLLGHTSERQTDRYIDVSQLDHLDSTKYLAPLGLDPATPSTAYEGGVS